MIVVESKAISYLALSSLALAHSSYTFHFAPVDLH